jgi:hypothetical protein
MALCEAEPKDMLAVRRLADRVRVELATMIVAESSARAAQPPVQGPVKLTKRFADRAIREVAG